MKKINNASGIILAGGLSTRIGRDKGRLKIGEVTLAQRSLKSMTDLFDDVVYVINDRKYLPANQNTRIAMDEIPNLGPLGGIMAGLKEIKHSRAFVIAYDMPFIVPELVSYLVAFDDTTDVVGPKIGGTFEPLHAVYNRSCLAQIAKQLATDDHKIINLFDKIEMVEVDEEVIVTFDPLLRSFFNINTWDDLKYAEDLFSGSDDSS